MTLLHFRLRRRLLPYLENGLAPREAKEVEKHLVDCDSCRGLLVRLRRGHQMARRLAVLAPSNHPVAVFEAVMEAVENSGGAQAFRVPAWKACLDRFSTPRAVSTLAILVVVQLALLVASNRGLLFGKRTSASLSTAAIDLSDFRPLSLDQLRSNTQPHVVTEGYVKDVHADANEGTVAFKLVQHPDGSGPFVVCEIMSPIRLAAPRGGTHVKVYGVSRYDAQTDRHWYELNPVLSIANVKR